MEIYIVATTRDTNNKINGYIAFDLDEKKSMIVSKASMVEAVLAGRAKIHNAILVKTGNTKNILNGYAMKGTKYPLDTLSYYKDTYTIFNKGILVLRKSDNNNWCAVSVANIHTVNCAEVSTSILMEYIKQNKVLNKDIVEKDILLDKISNTENNQIKIQENDNVKNDVIYHSNERLEELTRRALDNNDVWDMETFDEFMKLKGWSYSVDGDVLNSLDNRCDIIHIPSNIREISKLVMGKDIDHPIKKLVIGPRVRQIYSLVEKQLNPSKTDISNYIEVEEIYFQEALRNRYDMGELYLSRFTYCMHITRALNIPSNMSLIDGLYNWCIIEPEVCLDNEHTSSIYKSFNNTKFMHDKLSIGGVIIIEESFNNIDGIKEICVKDNNTLSTIKMSFIGATSLNKVNFEELGRLKTIYKSFINCGFKEVDLSHCNNLDTLDNGAFNDCKNLEVLKLPSRIYTLGLENLKGTKVKELVVNAGALGRYYISTVETDLRIRMTSKSLDGTLYVDKNLFDTYENSNGSEKLKDKLKKGIDIFSNIIFDTNIEIKEKAFSNRYIDIKSTHNSNLFKNVTKIDEDSFSESFIELFDSADLPNIDTIPQYCFKLSHVKTVVLDKNIVSIGQHGFKQVSELETLIISENLVKISKSAFADTSSRKIVKAYVIRGSFAANYLKLVNNFVVIEVGSVEEAREIVFGNSAHKNEKINKYRLIWGNNPQYKWIFEEPYVNYIDSIVKVLVAFNDKTEVNNLEYTRPNIMNVSLSSINKLNNIMNKCLNDMTLDRINSNDIGTDVRTRISFDRQLSISDKFIMLSDIVREFSEPYTELFNTNINERIESGDLTINSGKVLMIDHEKTILKFKLNSNHNFSSLIMLCIVESDTIVYAGVTSYDLARGFNTQNFMNRLRWRRIATFYGLYNMGMDYDIKRPIGEIFNVGDIICSGYEGDARGKGAVETKVIIGGAEFSRYEDIAKNMLLHFLDNTFYMGAYTETISKAKTNKDEVSYGLFIDSRSKTLFICKIFTSRKEISMMVGLTISEKYTFSDMKEVHSIVDERLGSIRKEYNIVRDFEVAKPAILYGDKLEEMTKNDLRYYDADRNNELAKLADKAYKQGYQSLNDNIAEDFIYELFNSSLMKNENCSFSDIKNDENYIRIKTYTYKNKYIQVYSYKDGYIMGIVDKKTKMNDKKVLKFSLLNIDSILDMLVRIGYILNNNEFRITPVSNRRIDQNYMTKIYTVDTTYDTYKAVFSIGIDKLSGYSHILLDCEGDEVISILRFNSMMDAYDVLFDYIIDSDVGLEIKAIANNETEENMGVFGRTRNKIINGFNMLSVTTRRNSLFKEGILKKACKQPPEEAMPDIFLK